MAFTPDQIPAEELEIVKKFFGEKTASKAILRSIEFISKTYPAERSEKYKVEAEIERLKNELKIIKQLFKQKLKTDHELRTYLLKNSTEN